MKNSLTRKAIRVFLVYVLTACLAAAGAYVAGVVFRQYLRIMNQLIITVGLITVLLLWSREISEDQKHGRKKGKLITAAVILLMLMGLSLQVFMGIDRETVTEKEGEKKIEVERSWLMFLERSYFDYENAFWYEKNPHFTENYDDGDPDQFLYTDYYNENGDFTERVYPDE